MTDQHSAAVVLQDIVADYACDFTPGDESGFIETLARKHKRHIENIAEIRSLYEASARKCRIWYSSRHESGSHRMVQIWIVPEGANLSQSMAHVLVVDYNGGFTALELRFQRIMTVEDVYRIVSLKSYGEVLRSGDSITVETPYFGRFEPGMALPTLNLFSSWARSGIAWQVASRSSAISGRLPEMTSRSKRDASFRKAYHGVIARRAKSRTAYCLKLLSNALDPDILRQINSLNQKSFGFLNWITASTFDPGSELPILQAIGSSPEKSLFRRQAARAFPLFLDVMTEPKVTQIIDNGEKLLPALTARTGIPTSILKRARGLTWQKSGLSPIQANSHVFEGLRLQHFPKDRTGFRRLRGLRACMQDEDGIGLDCIDISIFGDLSPERIESLLARRSLPWIFDAVDHIYSRLYLPLQFRKMSQTGFPLLFDELERQNAFTRFKISFLKTLGLPRAMEFAEDWHVFISKGLDPALASGTGWQALFGTVELPEGLSLREIHSPAMLNHVGRDQQHCVATYLDKITNPTEGRDNILPIARRIRSRRPVKVKSHTVIAIVERDGDILSTAEIRVDEIPVTAAPLRDGRRKKVPAIRISCVQNQGRGNRSPVDEAETAVSWLLEHTEVLGLTAERIQAYRGELQKWRGQDKNEIEKWFRFDPTDDVKMNAMWQQMSPLLPRSIRKAGMDVFTEFFDPGCCPWTSGSTSDPGKREQRKAENWLVADAAA